MSLTERLAKLSGPPAPVALAKPERVPLTARMPQGGSGVPLAPAKPSRARLTERVPQGGQAPVLGVPPPSRRGLTERLSALTGGSAPLAPAKAPRDSLAARLEAVTQIPDAPVPAVAKPAPGLHQRMSEIYQILQQTSPDLITLPFAEWLPDMPDFANPGATVARNVLPVENYYGPLGALQAATAALTARALGATNARDASGNNYNYAGDASKLYEVRASGVTDKSKGGGYSTGSDEVWEFQLFGDRLIATNFTDAVQGIDVGSAGLFADQFTSTLKPKARHLATIREFLFLGNTSDATDGAVPHRTWFSAYRDARDMDPDAQTQSDFEDRPAGGYVQRIVGGVEYGLLFQQSAITRITYSGGDSIFQFDSIDRKRGTPIPNGVVGHGRRVFFPSEEGFFVTDGTQSYPIGVNQVDKTFWAQFDEADAKLVSAAIDPLNKLYAIAFPGAGGVLKIYFYNWHERRWSEAEVDLDILFNPTSEGFTLEELDAIDSNLDTLTPSLDSPQWQGGGLRFGAFDTAHKLAYFDGANLAATLETGETELHPGRVSKVSKSRPQVDGGTITGAVAGRVRLIDTPSYDGSVALDDIGELGFLNEARYHRFRVSIAAGGTWNHAQGIQIQATPMGSR